MSHENVEVVKRGFAALAEGLDFETAVADFVHEEVVVRRQPPLPDSGIATGPEGLLEVIAEWLEDFDDFEMSGVEYIDAGDEVVVTVSQRARGAASGVPVTGTYWFVFEVAAGKVTRLDMYASREQALEAVGLAADPGEERAR
jgi:ketosteroid isomerase-like protein